MSETVAELYERGRRHHPGIDVDLDAFARIAVEKLEGASSVDAGEVYLACACEGGDPAAFARFEALYFSAIEPALSPMKLPASTIDDVRQLVRTKLFVGEGGEPPRLTRYAGQGTFEGLVRVIAVRTAISLQRKVEREVPMASTATVMMASAVAPELELVKQRYRGHFEAAFERAIEELAPRDRTLLKLHVLEGSSIDDLGTLYKVHRATAARWLETIRDTLGERTRELLVADLALSPAELDSVVRAVQSQVDVTLTRILR